MTGLLGRGALVNWGGVIAGGEQDYNAWHSLEHMPERLSVPGFRRGRRAVAVAGTAETLKYFMMYEAVDAEVFVSEPYLNRLNNPTPWTQRILSLYLAPSRTVCRVIDSRGCGAGGWMATLQWSKGTAIPHDENSLPDGWIEKIMAMEGVVGAHLLKGEPDLGQLQTTEKTFRESQGEPDRTIALTLLIDGFSLAETRAAMNATLDVLDEPVRDDCVATLYETQHVLTNADVGKP